MNSDSPKVDDKPKKEADGNVEEEEESSPCTSDPTLPRCKYVLLLEETGRYLAIMFIIALTIAAGLLAAGREALANKAAEYAYYLLVASVTSLLASTFLEPKVNGEPPAGEGGEPERGERRATEEPGGRWLEKGLLGPVLAIVGWWSRVVSRRLEGVERVLGRIVEERPFVGVVLYSLSFTGTTVTVGSLLGLSPVPGRPTILVNPFDWSLLFKASAAVLALTGAPLIIVARGLVFGIVFLVGLASSFYLWWVSPLPLAVLLYSMYKSLEPRLMLASISVSLTVLSLVTLTRPYHTWMSAWGWAGLTIVSVTALVLLFVGLTQVLTQRLTRFRVKDGHPKNGWGPEDRFEEEGRAGRPVLRHEVPVVLLVSLLASFLVVSSVHSRVEGIVSLDTVFHTAMCIAYESGMAGLLQWERPLFTLVACRLGELVGDYFFLFDKLWPLLGFTLLTTIAYVIARFEGVSTRGSWLVALLSMAYWTPFFMYAGFQTNLFSLPLAFVLARMIATDIERGWRLSTVLLAFVMVLFHPWTLAYYTVGMAAYLLAVTPFSAGALWERGRALAVSLVPAWMLYFALYSGKETYSVASIAERILFASPPGGLDVVNALSIFAWGTALRGDLLLPFALGVIMAIFVKGREVTASWPLVLSLVAGLGVFLFAQGSLIVRLLMNMPLPLALILLLEREIRVGGRLLALVALPALLVMVYYFYFAPLTPIGVDPIKILGEMMK